MEIQELKQYIIDNDKIETILSSLNLHHIVDKGSYFTAGHPQGDNPSSIVVYKDNLTVNQYTHEKCQGDLIALVMAIRKCDFVQALKWMHSELGLEWSNKKKKVEKPKVDVLSVFTSKLKSTRKYDVNDVEIYDDDILSDFGDCIHKDYGNNRITEKIRKEFGLCYDFQRNRTVIPWRCSSGLVGISGRTSNKLYEQLDIPKFYSYGGFKKSQCVYGLCENYSYIQQAGYVIVYEAEKSVLIRASLNDRTGVAIGGCNLSDEQARQILSLNCGVIIALDKDQSLEHIKELCSKFSKYRPTYYIYDKWNILGNKDSPADASNKKFNFLMKYKIKYDDN